MARVSSCRRTPTLAREVAQRTGDGATDDHAEIVERRIQGAVRIAPTRIARHVLRRIPAVDGQVETADEGYAVVDDDKLLVVRCPDRMPVVELELEPLLGARGDLELRQPFAFQREQQGKIPAENIDVELR